ncbi:hypothetical protein GQ54DRAFT_297205 [Martensiomyces pterosporus]|nr:hypothetical protein GQ54DRAFT_297205 [Martensiomyces pterosporus]
MPTLGQALRNNKPLIIGLVVAPLGLYSGVKIKEWRTENKRGVIEREVAKTSNSKPTHDSDSGNEIRIELQDLRNARSSLARRESLLVQESDSIDIKLKRLDEHEAEKAQKK